MDFTESQSIYTRIKSELDQLEIGVLVNNVGMLIGFRPFAEFENDQGFHDMVVCNTISVVRMTHIVLPQMIRRGRGIILNISSLSSVTPTPLMTVYGATKVKKINKFSSNLISNENELLLKVFVDKFSRDLLAEIKGQGVIIQTVSPGFVGTNMISHVRPSFFSPSADDVAVTSLQSLGIGKWCNEQIIA